MKQTNSVNGVTIPTLGGDVSASLSDHVIRNAQPKVQKFLKRRERMIETVREEQDDRRNAGKPGPKTGETY